MRIPDTQNRTVGDLTLSLRIQRSIAILSVNCHDELSI